MYFTPSCLVHYPCEPENCFLCASDAMAFNNSLYPNGNMAGKEDYNMSGIDFNTSEEDLNTPAQDISSVYPEIEPHMLTVPTPNIAPIPEMYPIPPFTLNGPILGRDCSTVTFDHPVPWTSRFSPLSEHDDYSDRFALEPEEKQETWAKGGYFVEDIALDRKEGGRKRPNRLKKLGEPLVTFFPEKIGWKAGTVDNDEEELVSPKTKTETKARKKVLSARAKKETVSAGPHKKKPSPLSTVTRALSPSPSPTAPTFTIPFKSTDAPKASGRKRKAVSCDEEEDTIFVSPIATPASKRQRTSVSSSSSLSDLDSLFGDNPSKEKSKSGPSKAKDSKGTKKLKSEKPRKSTRKRAKVSYDTGLPAGDSDSDDGDYLA